MTPGRQSGKYTVGQLSQTLSNQWHKGEKKKAGGERIVRAKERLRKRNTQERYETSNINLNKTTVQAYEVVLGKIFLNW